MTYDCDDKWQPKYVWRPNGEYGKGISGVNPYNAIVDLDYELKGDPSGQCQKERRAVTTEKARSIFHESHLLNAKKYELAKMVEYPVGTEYFHVHLMFKKPVKVKPNASEVER